MPYADINESLSLYYQVKGDGMPIVFIHPFVMGHNVFRHQEILSERYKTIFYDLAGHGRSSKGGEPITIEGLANDLGKLLDHIGVEKAVLCGYSHGGLVAQEFALKYPSRTIAIIMSGGFSEINNLIPKLFIKTIMFLAKLRQMSIVAKLQAKLNKSSKEDEQEIFKYARLSDARRSYEFCKAGLQYKSTPFLYRLKMPILLIYGTKEKPMHHYRIPFQKKAPQTEVVFIENGTHQLPPRSHLESNSAVDRFLRPIDERYRVEETVEAEGLG
ncbi:alpha/beta hydrolase [Bacillus sp. FJAT-27251]|uniref:alpha/beta fold hydrolase n=1 Tax=Bacillus sp. FJAT-27251 TaxID=1684142 RepID=UPI0006A77F8E|nr:alpha/beta hydrolase [Bacillus sp. FJAT-27251]